MFRPWLTTMNCLTAKSEPWIRGDYCISFWCSTIKEWKCCRLRENNVQDLNKQASGILWNITYLLFLEICSSFLANVQHSSFSFVKNVFWEVSSEYCSFSRNNNKHPTNMRCLWSRLCRASICRVVKTHSLPATRSPSKSLVTWEDTESCETFIFRIFTHQRHFRS